MSRFEFLDPHKQLFCLMREYKRRKDTRKILQLFPEDGPLSRHNYPKHMEFLAAGARYQERCIMAANRVGKSLLGGYEVACHATGWYPEWWQGKRYNKPTKIWCAGDTSQTVRDIAQFILLGPINDMGTGLIPLDNIIDINRRQGIPNAVESITVRHNSGKGLSTIVFKSYDQKRKSFQGTEQDVIWLDEECPADIWGECNVRTMTVKGRMILTFTPLMGLTDVVLKFMPEGKMENCPSDKYVIRADWDDAPHLNADEKRRLLADMPPHLRKARSMGIPHLGAGAIYPIEEEAIICEPFVIPHWYRTAYGMDVGWNKTACVWGAIDQNSLDIYLYSEYYVGLEKPPVHAHAIKSRGDWIPGVADPASRGRSQRDGESLFQSYNDLGLNISVANNAVEAGINDIYTLLSAGKLKVFSTLRNWLAEYRIYRRDENGKIVKENDHLMDATRYLINSGIQIARTKPYSEEEMRDRFSMPNFDDGHSRVGGY